MISRPFRFYDFDDLFERYQRYIDDNFIPKHDDRNSTYNQSGFTYRSECKNGKIYEYYKDLATGKSKNVNQITHNRLNQSTRNRLINVI